MNRDRWQEIWNVLARNKLRTLLTAFGVFWGIFMLVIMLGSGRGLKNGAEASFGGSARNSVFMWAQSTSKAYQGFNARRSLDLKLSDATAIKQQIPEVQYISPRCQAGGYRGSDNVTRGVKTGAFNIYGDTPEYAHIEKFNIDKGRYLNIKDLEEYRKVCFIGKEVYNALYEAGEEPLGTYVKAQGVNYKVIGVFSSASNNAETAERQEKAMIIPITTFQRTYNWGNKIGWLSFTSVSSVKASVVEQKVEELLKRRHQVHPEDERAFGGYNLQKEFERITSLITGIQWLSLIVGTLTLLAGAVGVSNIMVVTVRERTREFGIRRALGAPPSTIVGMVISEAVVLTLFAGMTGIILGVWSLEGIAQFMNQAEMQGAFFRNPGVTLQSILTSLGLLLMAGLLAGLIPARRAIQIKPVDALRFE